MADPQKLAARYITFDTAGCYTGTGVAEVEVDEPDLENAEGLEAAYYAATGVVLDHPDLPAGSLVAVTALAQIREAD